MSRESLTRFEKVVKGRMREFEFECAGRTLYREKKKMLVNFEIDLPTLKIYTQVLRAV